jgi:hypothetical protein
MVKKKFIQRRCVRKVLRLSLARSSRAAVLAVSSTHPSLKRLGIASSSIFSALLLSSGCEDNLG